MDERGRCSKQKTDVQRHRIIIAEKLSTEISENLKRSGNELP